MTELETKLLTYNKLYRIGRPIVSDKEYDDLFASLPPDSVLLKSGVIDEVPSERKSPLPIPMFSMDKLKTIKELRDWVSSLSLPPDTIFVITGKYDGISLCVNESTGKAWTRGDGYIGQDSTKHFNNMLSGSPCTSFEYTFGEAIMPKKLFKKYENDYANARNLVGGLLNSSKVDCSLQDVAYVRYGCSDMSMDKQYVLNELNKFNPVPVPFYLIILQQNNEEQNDSWLEETFDEIYQSISDTFFLDGIIIEVDDANLRKKLGREKNNNPAYARAIKLERWQKGDTVDVTGVSVEVSKQGCLKPVIQVVPTSIGGVTISNVTGYNMRYIKENKIGVGASIEIIRSGDVIPKHIKTLVDGKVEIPASCPFCGSLTVWDDNGVELVCSNYHCSERKIKKLVYFFEKAGIDNFSEKSVRDLYERGYDSLSSILNISVSTLSSFSGWGDSSALKLTNQFHELKTKGMPLADLMQARDVFEGKIGAKIAQRIFDELKTEDRYTDIDSLVQVEGVSNITAEAFVFGYMKYFSLPDIGVPVSYIVSPKKEQTGGSFSGWSVCFSGVRDKELEAKIEAEGGKIVSGVSKNTTHLIVKDLSDKVLSSSKCVKAKELGVTIIQISELK